MARCKTGSHPHVPLALTPSINNKGSKTTAHEAELFKPGGGQAVVVNQTPLHACDAVLALCLTALTMPSVHRQLAVHQSQSPFTPGLSAERDASIILVLDGSKRHVNEAIGDPQACYKL